MLIAARALQGLGGAVIAPASLSILTTTFAEGPARNRAVGIWGAMGGAGGAAGVLLGGVLTERAELALDPVHQRSDRRAGRGLRPAADRREPRRHRARRDFDLSGALAATIGLSLLVLGIVRTDVTGWGSAQTLALIVGGLVLLAVLPGHRGPLCPQPADAAADLRLADS